MWDATLLDLFIIGMMYLDYLQRFVRHERSSYTTNLSEILMSRTYFDTKYFLLILALFQSKIISSSSAGSNVGHFAISTTCAHFTFPKHCPIITCQ